MFRTDQEPAIRRQISYTSLGKPQKELHNFFWLDSKRVLKGPVGGIFLDISNLVEIKLSATLNVLACQEKPAHMSSNICSTVSYVDWAG
jgi:hypothetical protein